MTMGGSGGSNPPLSASQSRLSTILRLTNQNPRACAASCDSKVTGESAFCAVKAFLAETLSEREVVGNLRFIGRLKQAVPKMILQVAVLSHSPRTRRKRRPNGWITTPVTCSRS
jgi:hypothetical protein